MEQYFKAKIGSTLERSFQVKKPYLESIGRKQRCIYGKKYFADILDVVGGEVWLYISNICLLPSGDSARGQLEHSGDLRIPCADCEGISSFWNKILERMDKKLLEENHKEKIYG